tara:strand:- start:43 stop:285 length:243 start_codon:yes stop_codon:yes gene_type:complete
MIDTLQDEDEYDDDWLEVGDFASFRYVDADAHDPERKEVFHGLVIEITWEDAHGERMDWPSYRVLVSGDFRWFPHYEVWE